ncbi:MAG TPA: hypothetical protein VD789_13195, partial [Thermomicrobiales bacterium]|nr:hypothetical protein [Thermomicrobiales bacterium]
GKLAYTYNFLGLRYFDVLSESCLPAGNHQVRMEFAYDGNNPRADLGRGGMVTLYVDGEQVVAGRVERTVPGSFSLVETLDLGEDTGTPVSENYKPVKNRFNGCIEWAQIDTGPLDPELHMLEQHLQLSVALGTQ